MLLIEGEVGEIEGACVVEVASWEGPLIADPVVERAAIDTPPTSSTLEKPLRTIRTVTKMPSPTARLRKLFGCTSDSIDFALSMFPLTNCLSAKVVRGIEGIL
jgi:hypothetical protein